MGKVYLMGITQEAEGKYKCEVSTEGPKFNTDFKEANMSVYGEFSCGYNSFFPSWVLALYSYNDLWKKSDQ